jgi:hypothetical protein
MLREALVLEELKDNVETGTLTLLKGAPHPWLADGKRISVEKMRTYFGDISFNIERNGDKITATIDPPSGEWKQIDLCLRQPLKSVSVNGEEQKDFDSDGRITVSHREGKITVEATVK